MAAFACHNGPHRMTTLRRDQYIRYSRQLVLPEVQGEGQQRIFEARVLLVGMGGLGSPQALYLAGAGIGTIGLVDGDRVDLANLHRQIIYSTQDIGTPKVVSAASRIKALNPDTQVITLQTPWRFSKGMTSSWTARTTSRRAIFSTTPVSCSRSPLSMGRSTGSEARLPSFLQTGGRRAIDVSFLCHLQLVQCLRAVRQVFLESFPA